MHELKHKNLLEKIDFLHTEAVAKHKEGKPEEAISFYLESIKLDKNQPAWIYGNVITLLAEVERFDEGLKLGEEAEKIHPESDEVYRAIGIIYQKQNNLNQALTYFQKAIELNQYQEEWLYTQISEYKSQLRANQVQSVDYNSDNSLLKSNISSSVKSAIDDQDNTKKINYLHAEAVAKHKEGKLEKAISFYFKSIEVDENQPAWIYGNVITLLAEVGRLDEALELGEKAEKLHPESDEVYRAIAILFNKKGDIIGCVDNYQKAIQCNPQQPSWVYSQVVENLIRQNNINRAIEIAEQGIKLNPDCFWLHYHLGEAFTAKEKWGEAITNYFRAQEIQRDLLELSAKIKYSLLRLIEVKLLLTSVQLNFAALEAKQSEITNYRRELSIAPDKPELYLKLGNALGIQRRFDEAVDAYYHALELQSTLEQKQKLLQQIVTELELATENQQLIVTNLDQLKNEAQVAILIDQSGLFHEKYYLSLYQDVANSDFSPLEHFIKIGTAIGYKPNPFFDTKYYLEQNPKVAQSNINPLAHYIAFGSQQKSDPNPFFDTKYYLEQNPEVAQSNINPLSHYINFGAKEGRVPWSVDKLTRELTNQQTNISDSDYFSCLRKPKTKLSLPNKVKKIGIYTSSLGNQFMTEIAEFLATAFENLGLETLLLTETDRRTDNLDLSIIVAPHEFFYLGEERAETENSWLSRSVIVNVEQPHTLWFSKSLHYLQQAKVVFDINLQSAAMLEKMGINAYFLPLGYLQGYKPLENCSSLPDLMALKSIPTKLRDRVPSPEESLENRPIDLHFVGTLNQRREKFFVTNAPWLSNYRCFWHIPPLEGPLLEGQDRFLDNKSVVGLSRLSKILLNIHRDELPYFEWHRIVFHGLWQKTLVLTEPCYQIPGLIAGEHYIECPQKEMATTVDWLLNTEAGKKQAERVRLTGYEALREKFNCQQIIMQAIQILNN